MRNCVIIATNASFLAKGIEDTLQGGFFKTVIAADKDELRKQISAHYPRHVFIENCFIGAGTEEYIMKTIRNSHNVKIAVWSAAELQPVLAARFIMAGAESFFSLRDTESRIQEIIKTILRGRNYYPPEVEEIMNHDAFYQHIGGALTAREIQIIKLSVKGTGNKEIAKVLGVTLATVKFHKANAYRKCGGKNPVDLLRYGLAQGVICPEDLGSPGNGGKHDCKD